MHHRFTCQTFLISFIWQNSWKFHQQIIPIIIPKHQIEKREMKIVLFILPFSIFSLGACSQVHLLLLFSFLSKSYFIVCVCMRVCTHTHTHTSISPPYFLLTAGFGTSRRCAIASVAHCRCIAYMRIWLVCQILQSRVFNDFFFTGTLLIIEISGETL